MGSGDDQKLPDEESPSPSPSSAPPSFRDYWRERILYPTLLGGVAGGGIGLVSKHRRTHGLANISATYATNIAIVAGCYCGAREFVRVSRRADPEDLLNSVIAGFSTGALLGRLQGGQSGAIRYSVIFAVAGTTFDYATMKLKPMLEGFGESVFGQDENGQSQFKLPEWSPIQVLDEDALAAKKAREEKLYSQRVLGKMSKEES
ncbi:uncharacterized protein LOC116187539 [Punica granatum]|uniref:Uncharacterized protein n=2 Tax=Punica granatum TaxID=22663 RepID=A0A2I0K801_PUNGR|nr:uncharacterized protein LOC116187539 [Punica granatum]PKI64243.1 hypothetical protein CRG98_015353 [Punica granatum]